MKPDWGRGVPGCRRGREIIESYYGMSTPAGQYRGCSTYTDFRELYLDSRV